MKVKSLSRVQLFATPWTVAYKAPPSMGFSRQESWSAVPLPSPDFIFGGSKITADGDCSHEINRRLLLGRKVMTNLDNILKRRDTDNKGPSSQGYDFASGHVWM